MLRDTWLIRVFLFAIVIPTLFSTSALANPASPDPIWVQQPGGQAFIAHIRGDEHQGWVETQDGYTIVRKESTGSWEYAERKANGTLTPSGVVVKPGIAPPKSIPAHLTPARTVQSTGVVLSTVGYTEPQPVSGPKKLLIILVNFADRTLITSGTTWDATIFSTDPGQKSVANFYNDNSFGIVSMQPVPHTQPDNPPGIVTVTVPQNHPNCGKEWDYTVESAWINSAFSAASAYVDFASLDVDGDGILKSGEVAIYFILAGYEASGSTKTPNIWGHGQWSGVSISVQGKIVQRWALNGELNDAGVQHPIGVICHELGHSLYDLPDLYDTTYTNAGLGTFSLMSFGSWGRTATDAYSGTTPVGMDAWCREYLGWSTPRVNPEGTCSFPSSLSARDAAVKLAPRGTTEYFLIENRCSTGWDQGMERYLGTWTGALAILHVDTSVWSNAYIPGRHQGVVLEEASPVCSLMAHCYGSLTDLFYSGNNSSFTDDSVPNSRLYSGASTGVTVTNISTMDSTMGADICILPCAPTNISATPKIILPGGSSTLSATVGAGEVVDWYAGSCGGQFVGSGTVQVSPTVTTTYYARARNLTLGYVSSCVSVTVACIGSQNPIAATAGSLHSAVLRGDGIVWAWGDNNYSQLGDGTTITRSLPRKVSGLTGVVAVFSRTTHTVALTNDGTVWAWGDNSYGQLGDGTINQHSSPTAVTGLSGVVAVAAGAGYTVALKNDGTVWTWGFNNYGQLGDGTTNNHSIPQQISGLSDVIGIAAGNAHTLALKIDGTVVAWGLNSSGQLGNGTGINSHNPTVVPGLAGVKSIIAGGNHTFAIMSDGTLWAWGSNLRGQLGDGTTNYRYNPALVTGFSPVSAVAASDSHTIAIKDDGTVWDWGDDTYCQLGVRLNPTYRTTPYQVSGVSNAVAVAAGNSTSSAHSVVVERDGTVLVWGSNANGQLGNGVSPKQLLPVKVPGISGVTSIGYGSYLYYSRIYKMFTVASKNDGTALSWGDNYYGQLGDGSRTARLSPLPIPNMTGVASVATGSMHGVATLNDGTVWAWGSGSYGQLGNGSSTSSNVPVQVSGLTDVKYVSAGSTHNAALMLDGTVRTWGSNSNGELGDGTTYGKAVPVQPADLSGVSDVAAGYNSTMVLKNDGTVWGWGSNLYGAIGSEGGRSVPRQVSGLSNVASISAGIYHAMAIKDDGTVWSWGSNLHGLLGIGTTDSIKHPLPMQIPGLCDFTMAADGGDHVLALKNDGSIWAWGVNSYGQLGNGNVTNQYTPVQVAGLSGTVTKVAAGMLCSFAIKSDGTIWAWGDNSSGQLGTGYAATNPEPVTAVFDDISPIGSITINSGVAYATSKTVNLLLSAADDSGNVAEMRVSDDSVIENKPWQPFVASYAWTLSGADGLHTVSVQFRDASGNVSDVASASIILDTLPPTIQSIVLSPPMVAPGDIVQVRVISNDGSGIMSVNADGIGLALTEGVWAGQFVAASAFGLNTVVVTASDTAGLSTTDSKDYKVARVYGVACRNATDPIMVNACQNMLFKFWGKVVLLGSDDLYLNDGSGYRIKVVAPGYTDIKLGDYVSARGILDFNNSSPTLNALAVNVVKLN
ncbi:MAG: M6 family metalloprotease domain-containing protein [Armatimonadota bacterium]|nr:M6 family metalloprotease domain-containing protein [bacterium]